MTAEAVFDALKWPAAIALICLSAMFAGLTLGMLSLDKVELEVVVGGEDKRLAACASKIIPVRKNGNLLLCTFLVGNTACNSLSSILMADLEGGVIGFVTSTVLILFLAEIIPQAVCSRYALQIGAKVIRPVQFFIILFYPVAKPISMILDCTLGEEIGTIHTRQELSKLLQIHVNEGAIDKESGNILQGALHALNVMRVDELVTPVEDCYMLHISLILDFKTVSEIFETGFSRIPVYDKSTNDIVSILFAKDLILVDPDDETPLKYFISIFGRPVVTFNENVKVRVAFVKLRQGHGHLAIVTDSKTKNVLGVITLEDIVEEIIQEEIVDETDVYIDVDQQEHVPGRKRTIRSKFRLLNAQVRDSILSAEEVKALAGHLMANVELIAHSQPPIERECVKWVLQQSAVSLEEDPTRLIYEKGKAADFCLIVLTGRLEILGVAENEFRSDAGSLSVIAPRALFDAHFVADFSARIASDKARIVVVKRSVLEAGRRLYAPPDVNLLPVGVATDPNVRHAFAIQLFSRKHKGASGEHEEASPDSPHGLNN